MTEAKRRKNKRFYLVHQKEIREKVNAKYRNDPEYREKRIAYNRKYQAEHRAYYRAYSKAYYHEIVKPIKEQAKATKQD